ncbi:MAG: co-chaperone GroES [Patescibacteria group bacterium]
MNKVRPLQDNILLEPLEKEQKTASGIYIPDTAKEKPQEGLVVEVGAGKINEDGKIVPIEVKKGDRVLYKKWGGNEIKVDGKEYLIVKSEDILAVIE